MNRQKLHAGGLLLPLLGAFLVLSPLIRVFPSDRYLAGLPLSFVYVFAVWLGLILLARSLSHALLRAEDNATPRDEDHPP